MGEVAQTGYLQRLQAELEAADAELTALEDGLRAERGRDCRDDLPELAWARAHCEALQGWVQALQYRDAPERPFCPDDALHARAEHARNRLQQARAQIHERLQLLRQQYAFLHEAQLRELEEVYSSAQATGTARPRGLEWLRCELHAGWRLLERMLRAEDRDWLRARRDLEHMLQTLSRSIGRLEPEQRRLA
jgi:hypothetical protein